MRISHSLASILLGAALVSMVAPPPVRGADFSVNAITEFLSDVKATIAARDKNGDGKLDATELADRAWMLFVLDTDKDKMLSEQELREGIAKLSTQMFIGRANEPSKELAPEYVPEDKTPRRGPKPVKGADWAVETLMPDAELVGLDGEAVRLSKFKGAQGTVVAVLSGTCPVSKRYAPALARLEKEYAARGLGFVFIAAPGEEDAEAVKALKEFGVAGPIVRDPSGKLLRALMATNTTDVFALDAARTLIYRGALDDQYGLGYSRETPERRYAAEALEAILNRTRPVTQATIAPGCELEIPGGPGKTAAAGATAGGNVSPALPGAALVAGATGVVSAPNAASVATAAGEVTWHNRISRIVQANCETCHRAGGVGPFSFETYALFLKKAGTAKRVVDEGVMPPWFAKAPAAGAHTPWKNDRLLAPRDKADLIAWLGGSRPEGDAKDALVPRNWTEDWELGKPDMVYQIPQPIPVKAEGIMAYQSIMVDTKLTEDKWVSAWEVLPTARQVVHHILIYVYRPGEFGIPGVDEKRGYLAAYVPGLSLCIYPEGFAKALPAGSKLRFEIHYTPNGKATQDQVRLGVKFAPKPPEHVVEVAGIANVRLLIPAGAPEHGVAATWKAPGAVRLLSLNPHMHFRGKSSRFEVLLPTKEVRTLLEVPRYDFNWQVPVSYAEPPLIPAGSAIKVTSWFDNSTGNPANPNPNVAVRWGSQTSDEMMIGYVEYYREK
jgi:thiol-disulfide isomerase/thioredoxin